MKAKIIKNLAAAALALLTLIGAVGPAPSANNTPEPQPQQPPTETAQSGEWALQLVFLAAETAQEAPPAWDEQPSELLEPEPKEGQKPAAPIYKAVDLPADLQRFIYDQCEALGLQAPGVDYETVLALITVESSCNPNAVSGTHDVGLMQINESNHQWLQERLGITDFTDPKQNIIAGTTMLADFAEYEDPHKMLMAYNFGPGRAATLWAEGTTSSNYSRTVMERRAEIIEGGTTDE